MTRDFKIIAALADLHIGSRAVSSTDLKKQLKEHFFKPLEQCKYLDGIFILGDCLHTAVSLNSDMADLFVWFVDKVYRIAKKRKATCIVIRGTQSHDGNQLSVIRHYENNDDGVDFRVYETIEEITIWGDYKVLVVPDVKVKQLEEIDQYLTKANAYDLILGHGMIEHLQHVQQDSENMPTKTYVFDAFKLMRACKGPVLFGHVHQYQHLCQHFYYVGPFTMLERGWQDAGFILCGIYDKDRTKFKVEHYINPMSAEYYEFVITKKILDTIPVDEIINTIDDVLEHAKPNDLVTIRITRGSEVESADKVMIIEGHYQKDKRISIVKKIKSKAEVDAELEHEELMQKYSYLMDESLELSDIAYKYYITDFKPTITDQRSPAALLTEKDFIEAFALN